MDGRTYFWGALGTLLSQFQDLLGTLLDGANGDFSTLDAVQSLSGRGNKADKPTYERFMRSRVRHLFVPGISRSSPALTAWSIEYTPNLLEGAH